MALIWHPLPHGRRGMDAFAADVLELELACAQLEARLRQRLTALLAESLLLERALLDQTPRTVEMPRLLVIDDDPSIRGFLEALLAIEGYEVFTAADGIDGLCAVDRHQPDCVLLDVMMPGVDGFQVLTTLRSAARHAHLPVVMISAASDSESARRARQLGADRFLAKPFEMEHLLSALLELCATTAASC